MNKYELTNETKEFAGTTLYRIKALRDFRDVREGELGGWVGGYKNLSQEGYCWVYEHAYVSGNAKVHGNAKVYEHAYVSGNAKVVGNAKVYGYAWVSGDAYVYGNAKVSGDAWVHTGIITK